MKYFTTLLLFIITLMVSSCNDTESRTKQLVRDFMKENMLISNIENEEFGKIDSTCRVTPQRVEQMRKDVKMLPQYQKNIKYAVGQPSPVMLYVTVKYDIITSTTKKTCKQTFYIDKAATRIIAFKDN